MICHLLSVICHLSSVICYLLSVICHLLSVICYLSSVICYLSSVIYHPPSLKFRRTSLSSGIYSSCQLPTTNCQLKPPNKPRLLLPDHHFKIARLRYCFQCGVYKGQVIFIDGKTYGFAFPGIELYFLESPQSFYTRCDARIQVTAV